MTLHATINELASNFAHDLLRALRGASLEEIISETSGHGARLARGGGGPIPFRAKKGKRIRRSPEQLQKVAEQIVAIVKAHPKGINAEAIKAKMGIKSGNVGAKVFTKPLGVALASKKITKRGNRRSTMYFG